MNATVARIVEIMFQDTVMTDEVQAIKDEVMNNCQERYQDMLDRGMDEDSAIAAVIDSLKGMEEVIAEYPHKEASPEETEQENADMDLTYHPAQVEKIKVFLTADDVSVETSTDDLIHVYYNAEEMPNVQVELQHGTLVIERKMKKDDASFNAREAKMETKASEWRSLSDVISDIGKLLCNLKVKVSLDCNGGGDMTIAVPQEHAVKMELHTTSGDVEIDGIMASEVMVTSTSGDVTVNLPEHVSPEQIKVNGASGDVEINASTRCLQAHTVSGDVACTGRYDTVFVNTVSGDGEVNGAMREVKLNSVSGDMMLHAQDETLRKVQCNTTSGDLCIHLPEALRGQAAVQLNTMSGCKRNRFGEPVGAALVHVQANSVSGDVELK